MDMEDEKLREGKFLGYGGWIFTSCTYVYRYLLPYLYCTLLYPTLLYTPYLHLYIILPTLPSFYLYFRLYSTIPLPLNLLYSCLTLLFLYLPYLHLYLRLHTSTLPYFHLTTYISSTLPLFYLRVSFHSTLLYLFSTLSSSLYLYLWSTFTSTCLYLDLSLRYSTILYHTPLPHLYLYRNFKYKDKYRIYKNLDI